MSFFRGVLPLIGTADPSTPSRMNPSHTSSCVTTPSHPTVPAQLRVLVLQAARQHSYAHSPPRQSKSHSVTGTYLFNLNVIKSEQMMPEEATFPLQPSPVHAVMVAYHPQPLTAFYLNPETHAPVARGSAPTPTIPTRPPRVRDLEIDPELYTPTKRTCMMSSALGSTSSRSFLVSSAKITSLTFMPPFSKEGRWFLTGDI
ncbi:hypothetical protein DFH09DRAFT_1318054 [Mycena vulgaris]|nr:hypothetical protein DFH09DRAFT_1318054 [Mycena vulgaris]